MVKGAEPKTRSILQGILCVCVGFLVLGCSRTSPPADVVYEHRPSPYHIVATGESIASIAEVYLMDVYDLVRLNGLKPPYRLVTGQRLLVSPAVGHQGEGAVSVSDLYPNYQVREEGGPPPGELGDGAYQLVAPEEKSSQTLNWTPTPEGKKPTVVGGISLQWPVKGEVIKEFDPGKGQEKNNGINIAAPRRVPVLAAASGTVVYVGNNRARGFGNVVLVKHASDFRTAYAHLDEVLVTQGTQISKGQKIGTVGNTGNVTQTQLHFEVRQGTTPRSPQQFLTG